MQPDTDTPRTDQFWETSSGGSDGLWHARDFCREIERECDTLKSKLNELYNLASFDWDMMPEKGRRDFHSLAMEILSGNMLQLPEKTDTPRTNSKAFDALHNPYEEVPASDGTLIDADFARELERELNDLKRSLAKISGIAF
jgi:hypothetical protein